MPEIAPMELFQVEDDTRDILAVANTITTSFSNDPLIRWLRPNAPAWSTSQGNTTKWQYRRTQRAVYEGMVFKSATVDDLVHRYQKSSAHGVERDNDSMLEPCSDAGAAVLLFPPQRHWKLSKLFLGAKLWFLDWWHPVVDHDVDKKRLELMIQSHETALDRIKSRYKLDHLWYLEVVALHPSLQNRGLGRQTMEWVMNYIGQQPVALECTAEHNVKFYEKVGFVTSEVADLSDNDGSVKLWFMVRVPGSTDQLNK